MLTIKGYKQNTGIMSVLFKSAIRINNFVLLCWNKVVTFVGIKV